ncbi:MarP family serine protease [Gordonia sp. VNQ95]|uniref:MarP family serine protease n=1 Tax=Gordonia sp. VNQ95 TaxID=3156619 RepID=UPI0032B3FAA0
MTSSTWVDIVVIAVALIAAISGYRHGAVASALAVLGVLLGAVAGILLVPHVYSITDDPNMKLVITVVVLVGLVVIGELAGMILGSALRSGIRSPELRAVDSGVGLVLQAVAAVLAMWLLSIPLSHEGSPLKQAIDNSAVLGAVGQAAPAGLEARAADRFDELFQGEVFDGVLRPTTTASQVDPPDAALANSRVVRQVRASVVKIEGEAPGCGQALEGSGFVVGPDLVMTNAHVVAGTTTLTVTPDGGAAYDADVVLFDAGNDVAVLRVSDLGAEPLEFAAREAATGDDAIVLGFPEAGPFRSTAVRIRGVGELPTANIYRNRQVVREVYTVRGVIRQGNSGGPMINANGEVLGVVFATAENPADETGYALTANVVRSDLERAQGRYAQVRTGVCLRE